MTIDLKAIPSLYDITGDIKDINTMLVTKQLLEAAEKDAARYRWLREQHWNTDVIGVLVRPKTHSHLGSIFPSLKLLDDTIDHMRKEQNER